MYATYGKRLIDIIGSSIAIILLALPMLGIALWIRLDSRGPALFRQQRYGQNKQMFTVFKFRSMTTCAPSDKATSEFADSSAYITNLGRILRKLSLDELPQFINVLRGDMSLIGPRPLLEKKVIDMRDKHGANDVKPGITGWAQVNGRDELDNATKVELDGYYAENVSLWMDIKTALKTVYVIAARHGHAEGHEQKSTRKSNDTLVAGE